MGGLQAWCAILVMLPSNCDLWARPFTFLGHSFFRYEMKKHPLQITDMKTLVNQQKKHLTKQPGSPNTQISECHSFDSY